MKFQTTIREEAAVEGIGLHTGKKVRLVLRPAPANAGIRFFRMDLAGHPIIPARTEFVSATLRGTTLELGEAKIHTVEHVLSAAAGLGIDNLDITLDSPEPPAMDGSALPFAQALLKAGIQEWPDHPPRRLRISEEVRFESGETRYRATPSQQLEISVSYEYPNPLVGRQRLETPLDPALYLAEVAGARTFCFEEELQELRKRGLGKGGSLENAVVFGKGQIRSSPGGLRFPDEPVRHKALDLVGDLALLGRRLDCVRIEAVRPGHAHNTEFAKILNQAARRMRAVSLK